MSTELTSLRMATNIRWISAYELAIKSVGVPFSKTSCAHIPQDWWNKDVMQGPVIEQATHICTSHPYAWATTLISDR